MTNHSKREQRNEPIGAICAVADKRRKICASKLRVGFVLFFNGRETGARFANQAKNEGKQNEQTK